MCDKGRFAGHHFAESAERLTQPLVDGAPAELADAEKRVAEKLKAAGANSVILAGGRLSNEDLFNLKQLADGLGGKALLHTPIGGGEFTTAYGLTAGSNLGDLGKGSTVLVVASDVHDEAPVWYLRIKAAAQRGAALIVANARATKLDEFATHVVRYACGDEVETVKGLTGKEKFAEAFKAENLVVFYGSDGLGAAGTAVLASACADLVKSRAGKPNNGLVGVWNAPNTQGAYELGFRTALDIASELKGKAVYVAAADPAGDDPALADALRTAEFVAVQDLFLTETAKLAGVVLPASAYTEREGTFTSAERRVQRFYPAVPARPGTKSDFTLTADIAGFAGMELEGRSALLVFNKLAEAVYNFSNVFYGDLAKAMEQYPLIGRGDLYYGGTTYENTHGIGVHLCMQESSVAGITPRPVLRPKENELLAVPASRVYDRGTTMTAATLLEARTGGPLVAVHPATAGKLGLAEGEPARVSLNGSDYEVVVELDDSLSTGVVLVYRSFGIPIFEPVPVSIAAAERARGGH
jgi:NADH-quinone oxidoreductase subunit G